PNGFVCNNTIGSYQCIGDLSSTTTTITSISSSSNSYTQTSNTPIIIVSDTPLIVSGKMITSSFNSTSSSIISFKIVGSNSNSKIIINGDATLNGTLRLEFEDGYIPKDGDRIELIQYGTYNGKFRDVCFYNLIQNFH